MNALAQAVLRARITPRHQPARQIPISCSDQATLIPVRYPAVERLAAIKRAVCDEWAISHADLVGPVRLAGFVTPRHVAMYLARTLTACSLPQIGKALGGRDHTTVLNGWRSIERRLRGNDHLDARIRKVASRLNLRPHV